MSDKLTQSARFSHRTETAGTEYAPLNAQHEISGRVNEDGVVRSKEESQPVLKTNTKIEMVDQLSSARLRLKSL